MRAASPALIAWLAALRAAPDSQALFADCFRLTLRGGAVLAYTNAGVPITLEGVLHRADSVLISGMKFRCAMGLSVDQQQISIAARATDLIGGTPFLAAVRAGALDGCEIVRERAFLTSWTAPPVGGVVLFKGRVATIDKVGRTSADLTVASDLVLLDIDMPRNLFGPSCAHVLFDGGCGLDRNVWSALGAVGVGATTLAVPWPGASAAYAQGAVRFTSGANAGLGATIKSVASGALQLASALPEPPAPGDAFVASQGCDHTQATCAGKFGNLANFRGFPYVPPPTWAIP